MALERDSRDPSVIETALQLFNCFPNRADLACSGGVVCILLNEAMKAERAQALEAHHERSAKRRGRANGFKPKTISARLGRTCVAIP
jgi:hypothetical protein